MLTSLNLHYVSSAWRHIRIIVHKTGLLLPVGAILLTVALNSSLGLSQDLPSNKDEHLSLSDITEGMRKEVARFTSIRIKYTCSTLLWFDRFRQVKGSIEGVYAHKLKEGSAEMPQLLDTVVYWEDPNTGTKDIFESKLCAFDGRYTRVLIREQHPQLKRNRGRSRLKEGYVYKGFARRGFLGNEKGPFREVWYSAWDVPRHKYLLMAEFPFRVVGRELYDGLSAILIESYIPRDSNIPSSHQGCEKMWICPDRGFLPLKTEFWRDGRLVYQCVLSDLTLLPNGAWFPLRIQLPMVVKGELVDNEYLSIWQVQEISLEPIPDSFFTIEFPPGTRIYDEVEGMNYTIPDVDVSVGMAPYGLIAIGLAVVGVWAACFLKSPR